ncbi:betaine-aldehyde dehydrogenase [Aspergillus japonicus CBS 114.51]|uniref:aldehyde dehydrogenase (NAD(+)) n=1 Tax=Aspergillus japonicus CBS 114.51 TaxID=1448312 RepID=A0A8T8X5W2_ASPJA|nr:betaine-aldehyde dehydrogenase [Aspergillus japonicus CBS 114.51]RAH83557.1 betaine-aldehyde dehydrogenase [Aspergillus japonicus CBS 114.51]
MPESVLYQILALNTSCCYYHNMTGPTEEPTGRQLFINGKFVPSSNRKVSELTSPCTNEKVAEIYEANEVDVDAAVAAASVAFPAWRDVSPADRGVFLRKMASLIQVHEEEFAHLEALSTGKPVSRYIDSRMAIETFNYFAEAGWTAQGSSSRNTPGHLNITVKEPYGVVAAIIPWNVPLASFATKIAPAVAAGNTIVLKSSEKSPLTIGLGAKLIAEAGFPPGVVNMLHKYGPTTGNAIASHMDVRCISFTGSSLTGRKIQAAAAKSNMKTVHMDLGGKTPALIFEDAGLESAAEQTQFSVQFSSGQTCIANSRIYVQETVADKFLAIFKDKFGAAILGNPLNKATDQGSQADRIQYERNGNFIKPTVFEEVPEESQIMKEEVFGPVVVINTFGKEDEAIAKANHSEFSLYASVFTKNIDRAMRVSKLLEAGTVGVNCTSPSMAKDMPFGGWKGSGIGREVYLHSMDSYLETKSILIKTS